MVHFSHTGLPLNVKINKQGRNMNTQNMLIEYAFYIANFN